MARMDSHKTRRRIRTPDQRLRVFISSTLGELTPERQAARTSVERLRLAPILFELGARPHPPRALYRSYLAQSDVFVGIYWQRYGWVAPDMDVSGLEDEFVLSEGMPRLIYVKRPAPEMEPRLVEMLATLKNDDTTTSYKPFRDANELQTLVLDDLAILLAERFEAGQETVAAKPAVAGNLPSPTSTFLGREDILGDLAAMLDAEDIRLVTLTGPGGTGKTRLSVEVAAARLERFQDGVFFVDLSQEREPDHAFSAMITALGIEGTGDDPPLKTLEAAVSDRELLLVLDNLEQVTAAGPGLIDLLQCCPRVRILATSREALRVRGERIFSVPPLSLPRSTTASVEDALNSEAVRLFVERAAETASGFVINDDNAMVVADICSRLDGLPLAIELAAARVRLFGVHQLRARLDKRLDVLAHGPRDLPERQRTLHDAIEWSYELLSPDDRNTFRFLAVFSEVRLSDLEATAPKVPSLQAVDIVGAMGSLVDKSLVYVQQGADGHPRFSMLQTIRSYATEQVDAMPDYATAVRRAHAEHYTALALHLHHDLTHADRAAVMATLSAEVGNLRAAWGHWLEEGDTDRLNDMLEPLWGYYEARGDYRAAMELGDDLLRVLSQRPESPERTVDEYALQMNLARARRAVKGFTHDAERDLSAALAISELGGDELRRFSALRSLANLRLMRSDFVAFADVASEMMAIAERQQDPTLLSEAHLMAGMSSTWTDDLTAAAAHMEKSIEYLQTANSGFIRFRIGPNPKVVSHAVSGLVHWMLGFADMAASRVEQALAIAVELDHPYSTAYALHHAALLDLWRLDLTALRRRADELLRIADAHDYPIWRALARVLRGTAMVGSGDLNGLTEVDVGFRLYNGISTPPVFWPSLLMIRAGTYAMAGRIDDALALIQEAEQALGGNDATAAELAIVHGDLRLRALSPDVAVAEALFLKAGKLARDCGARMAQLQAVTRLASLHRGTPRYEQSCQELRAIFETFTEGFNTPQLIAARSELEGNYSGRG